MKYRLFLLLLCLCLMLCSCAKPGSDPTAAVTETTESTEPIPVSFRQEQLVRPIDGLSLRYVPEVAGIGNGLVAISSADYEELTTELYVYDVNLHEIVRSAHLNYAGTLMSTTGQCGMIALLCYEDQCYYILNDQLEQVSVFTPEELFGKLSLISQTYYYVVDEVLYRMDIPSGSTEPMTLPNNLTVSYLYSIDPTTDNLVLQLYPNIFSNDTVMAVLNGKTAQLQFLQANYSYPAISGNTLSFLDSNWDTDENSLCWGTIQNGAFERHETNLRALGFPYIYPEAIEGSPYYFFTDDTPGYDKPYLCILGEGMKLWAAEKFGLPQTLTLPAYLPQEELLVYRVYTGDHAELYLIDPKLLPDTPYYLSKPYETYEAVDSDILSACETVFTVPELTDYYSEVRAKADLLERTYGIRIMLSSQCNFFLNNADFYFDDSTVLYDELADITNALNYLEQALNLYPDDFFFQFRNGNGDGGICVFLTGPMDSTYNVIGFEQQIRSWNMIAMDINWAGSELGGTFCHEMWHAIEDHAWGSDDYFTLMDDWDACNPDDFEYTYDHEAYIWNSQTYYNNNGSIYFVDNYSCTFPKEDRARLMEYVMWYPDAAEIMLQHEPMREKMDILCDLIRSSFDVADWNNFYWERYRL